MKKKKTETKMYNTSNKRRRRTDRLAPSEYIMLIREYKCVCRLYFYYNLRSYNIRVILLLLLYRMRCTRTSVVAAVFTQDFFESSDAAAHCRRRLRRRCSQRSSSYLITLL